MTGLSVNTASPGKGRHGHADRMEIQHAPWRRRCAGAATGAWFGSLRDVGISDAFINEIREKVTPGTSALFVLSTGGVYDRLAAEFSDTEAELIHTNLSDEQEAKLREAFGLEE